MSQHEPTSVGPDDAEAFLAQHLGHAVEVEHVGEGMWSRAFAFRHDDRELVVRFGQHREDYEKDRFAGRFASLALPIPEVLDIGTAFDGHFAISMRAWGTPLEALDEAGWRRILPALFAALDALHAVDLPANVGFGGWDGQGRARRSTWRDFLIAVDEDSPTRRTHGWRDRLAASSVGDAPFVAGLARLAELSVGLPELHHVIHADLINRNVLVAGDRLGAVLDWGCASYGDSLYDIAWLEHWAPWYAGLEAIDIRAQARHHHEARGHDLTAFDRRIRCSALHIGLDHQAYNAWVGDEPTLQAVVARTQHYLDDAN